MNMYAVFKTLHVSCAMLSILLFAWRWQLALRRSPLLQQRWLHRLPQINDTLLLAAAVSLLALSGQYALGAPWLSAKIVAVVVYIILGTLALRAWRQGLRWGAGVSALSTAGYIVSVALSKDARGFLAWF